MGILPGFQETDHGGLGQGAGEGQERRGKGNGEMAESLGELCDPHLFWRGQCFLEIFLDVS